MTELKENLKSAWWIVIINNYPDNFDIKSLFDSSFTAFVAGQPEITNTGVKFINAIIGFGKDNKLEYNWRYDRVDKYLTKCGIVYTSITPIRKDDNGVRVVESSIRSCIRKFNLDGTPKRDFTSKVQYVYYGSPGIQLKKRIEQNPDPLEGKQSSTIEKKKLLISNVALLIESGREYSLTELLEAKNKDEENKKAARKIRSIDQIFRYAELHIYCRKDKLCDFSNHPTTGICACPFSTKQSRVCHCNVIENKTVIDYSNKDIWKKYENIKNCGVYLSEDDFKDKFKHNEKCYFRYMTNKKSEIEKIMASLPSKDEENMMMEVWDMSEWTPEFIDEKLEYLNRKKNLLKRFPNIHPRFFHYKSFMNIEKDVIYFDENIKSFNKDVNDEAEYQRLNKTSSPYRS